MDNHSNTNTASVNAVIASSGGGSPGPLTWAGTFGAINAGQVTLTLTLDLSTDIPETSGPEALNTWKVDSLKWNPAVLSFSSIQTIGWAAAVSPSSGKVSINAVPSGTLDRTHLVTLATITFNVIGASSSSTTTTTYLGPIVSQTASYVYNPKISIQEPTFTVP
jgi:hypothetical protein